MQQRAARDDSYDFGRWLFQYNSALLLGMRISGDLRLLDEVDLVAQTMRAQLRDGWCGGRSGGVEVNVRYGTVSVPDGYLNFRWRGEHSLHHCRDTADLDEGLIHGHLALVMYAYHANRHLESPSGIDYGERAEFWLDYLRNHFEAKWRGRSSTRWPAMDFIDAKFCHTYLQMTLFHYFVGKRLQDDGSEDAGPYLRQALRLSDGMFDVPYIPGEQPGGFVDVQTPLGEAVVYSFGAPGDVDVTPTHLEGCAMTYARYMLASVLNLRLESFSRWDDDIMTKIARGLAHFMLDTDDVTERSEPFAAGVAGDEGAAGIAGTEYRTRSSAADFNLAPFAAFAAWDSSGRIADLTLQVLEEEEPDQDRPEQVFIAASMLFVATVSTDRR
ncbi:MAG: hypothetical protein H0X64_09535, partial [Gemmatimonadaceae bacterium]|nr:hypothetical protein [Gemmatimonadaceae bacterium]